MDMVSFQQVPRFRFAVSPRLQDPQCTDTEKAYLGNERFAREMTQMSRLFLREPRRRVCQCLGGSAHRKPLHDGTFCLCWSLDDVWTQLRSCSSQLLPWGSITSVTKHRKSWLRTHRWKVVPSLETARQGGYRSK